MKTKIIVFLFGLFLIGCQKSIEEQPSPNPEPSLEELKLPLEECALYDQKAKLLQSFEVVVSKSSLVIVAVDNASIYTKHIKLYGDFESGKMINLEAKGIEIQDHQFLLTVKEKAMIFSSDHYYLVLPKWE